MYFAQFMKDLRQEKSLTQTEIAEILGVSVQSIKKIENGTTNFPSKILLNKLANYLDQFPVAIASKIIFGDEDCDRDEVGYLSSRYLAYKYINGWNLDEVPIWLEDKTQSICFAGKISKRREPKNTSIVIEFSEFILKDSEKITLDDAYGILSTIMMIVSQNEESFRRVEVLFDLHNYYESEAFQILESVTLYHVPTDLILVEFEPDTGAISREISVKK